MVSDLLHSPLAGHPIECLLFGGAPAPESLVERVQESFPESSMWVITMVEECHKILTCIRSTAYGLTETNSIAVSVRTALDLSLPFLNRRSLRSLARITLRGQLQCKSKRMLIVTLKADNCAQRPTITRQRSSDRCPVQRRDEVASTRRGWGSPNVRP